MPELVIYFALALGLIALVGHGLWLLAGLAVRALLGWPVRPAPAPPPRVDPAPRPSRARDLEITLETLWRLRLEDRIDGETYRKLSEAVRAERLRILRGPVEPAPDRAAVPAVPPPEPTSLPEPTPVPVPAPLPVPAAEPLPVPESSPVPEAAPAAVPVPAPEPAPAPPPAPRRALGEVLAAFLEERNIRWGELIAGMIIVVCSTALVLSLWEAIASRPVGKLLTFVGTNTALFGAGLFMHRRWRLPMTTRSILVIATLLVPLNALAMAAFALPGSGATPALLAAGEALAMALFASLVFVAGRSIAPSWPGALALAVAAPSALALVAARLGGQRLEPVALAALAGAVLAAHTGAVAWAVATARAGRGFGRAQGAAAFTLQGAGAVAALRALGLLAVRSRDLAGSLPILAPFLGGLGAGALAGGLLVWRRTRHPRLAAQATAGMAAALLGAVLLAASVALAWPRPWALVAASLVGFVSLTAAAVGSRLPAAHLPAAAFLLAAYLVASHALLGGIGWLDRDPLALARCLASALSGTLLVPLAALAAGAAAGLARRGRRDAARGRAIAAAGVAAVSLVLATAFGFGRGEDGGATWTYAAYAAAALADAAIAADRAPLWARRAAWAGSALLLLALAQGLAYRYPALDAPWRAALLLHASFGAGMALALDARGGQPHRDAFGPALAGSAALTSAAAAGLLLVSLSVPHAGLLASQSLWLAPIWAALALRARRPWVLAAAEAATLLSACLAAAAWASGRDWFAVHGGGPRALLDPRALEAQGIALCLVLLAWTGARFLGGPAPWRLLARENAASRALEAAVTAVLLALLLGLGLRGAWPGVVQELASSGARAERLIGRDEYWHASGPGAWAFLASLTAVLAAGFPEGWARARVRGLVLVGAAACLILAGPFDAERAGASALRWSLAAFWLLASGLIWGRARLPRLAPLLLGSRDVLLVVTAGPVLALSVLSAVFAAAGEPPSGPDAASWLGRMGPLASNAVPLLALSAGLAGHALRERSASFALAGGLVLNVAVTLGFLLRVLLAGRPLGSVELVRLLQVNGVASGLFALGWLAVVHRWGGTQRSPGLLRAQVALAAALAALPIVEAAAWLVVAPENVTAEALEAGTVLGCTASGLALASAGWLLGAAAPAWAVAAGLLALAGLSASAAVQLDRGSWLAYRVLLAGTVAAAALTACAGWLRGRLGRGARDAAAEAPFARAAWAAGALAVLLSLRALVEYPGWPWPTVLGLCATGLLGAALAFWRGAGAHLLAATPLFNLAATVAWLAEVPSLRGLDLLHVNVLALALPALLARGLALLLARPGGRSGAILEWSHHRLAALAAAAAVAVGVAVALASDAAGHPRLDRAAGLAWAAWGTSVALAAACLPDPRAALAPAGLFVLGLAGIGLALDRLDLGAPSLTWTAAVVLPLYALAAGAAAHRLGGLSRIRVLAGLGIACGLLGSIWTALRLEGPAIGASEAGATLLRLAAATAVFAGGAAAAVLSWGAEALGGRKAALGLAAAGSVAWAWAWLAPHGMFDDVPHRAVLCMTALAAAASFAGILAVRLAARGGPRAEALRWLEAARGALPALLAAAGASLAAVLLAEVSGQLRSGQVFLATPAVAAVAGTLAALAAAAATFAAVPRLDPLAVPERRRGLYVYGAEALIALLFVHVRLARPEWFTGFFTRYWPLVVMALALAGAGLGEVLRRRALNALSEPLTRTGAFLPLLPVLGYWMSDWVPRSGAGYTLQLVLVGLVYLALAVTRKSFGFGLLSALSANGGLWFFLHDKEGFRFLEHPQLCLAPAALSVLLAAHLNRERLGDQRTAAVRYGALLVVYVSSTADIFIAGVAESPWLPMVLAGLSVCGLLAGIAFRVRSFLVLGSTFLLLALLTMVWHASASLGWTWLWWVAGLALGVALLVLFALFERRRERVLEVVEELRRWKG
ncbi:MAG: hypothetical protein HY721_12600 [Planctomycetes bacterium]|nr:hypothetical protein [Planctomycetota bacterium]